MEVVCNINWTILLDLSEMLNYDYDLLCEHRNHFISVLRKLEKRDKNKIYKIKEAIKSFEFTNDLQQIDKETFRNYFLAVLKEHWDDIYI